MRVHTHGQCVAEEPFQQQQREDVDTALFEVSSSGGHAVRVLIRMRTTEHVRGIWRWTSRWLATR